MTSSPYVLRLYPVPATALGDGCSGEVDLAPPRLQRVRPPQGPIYVAASWTPTGQASLIETREGELLAAVVWWAAPPMRAPGADDGD